LLNKSGPPVIPSIQGVRPNLPVAQTNKVFKAVATKAAIKLDKKVKPLHWTRMLILPSEAPNRPNLIWNKIKEADVNLNDILTLFEVKV
jgi:hypothetical protein